MKRILYIWILLLFSVLTWAQASGIPYSCSFEEDEDKSGWVLNYGTPDANDIWVVGDATHSEGHRSLYISSDGVNPRYGNQPNIVVSYLRFKFPESSKTENYDISFDWKGMGDTTTSRLRVLFCPEQLLKDDYKENPYYIERIISTNSGILPTKVVNACELIGDGDTKEKFVCGREQWQNVSLNTVGVLSARSKLVFAIVFIWENNNKDENIRRSGICIDNLQIGPAQLPKPKKMTVEPVCDDSTMIVSWESTLSEFEVQYRKLGSSTWRRADGIMNGVDGFTRTDGTHCSYVLHRIMEGSYDVRVRGVAGNLSTNYIYKNNILIYCPDNHCINYLDLEGPNVECTYGWHPNSQNHPNEGPYTYSGVINYGPDSEESRHTIHTDPTETDPRTDDGLLTVPPGALASVRLGNWKQTGEAEAITYTITVDAENQGILIVKYATIVESSGHPREGEPFFRLEILDENGNLIDESCGHADYAYSDAVASGDLSGWHISKSNSGLAWKEWTTVGVNLMPYAGQTIKVRFTTADCFQTIHMGYAYFTVDCASAHIETDNCGNDAKITCNAPEGFSYKWYNEAGLVVGTERELEVDASRQTYTCRVSFIEEPDCWFEVSTESAPRFPVPDYRCEPVYGECMSKLKFTNKSHVMTKYDGEENHTNEPCNDFHWTFRQLSTGVTNESYNPNPVYSCPEEGDSIEVTLTCYIGADNACDSTRTDTIVARNIYPENPEFHYATCPETPVFFDGKLFSRDTVYETTHPNFAGCDSTATMYLKVYPKIKDTYRHDSICSNAYVVINGESYNQPMDSQKFYLKTIHGCDSIVYLTLTVNPRLEMQMAPYGYSCADDESFFIAFDISVGQFDSLNIEFNTPQLRDTTIYDPSVNTILIPFSPTILPGSYKATLTFHQYCCGIQRQERAIEILYRSSIVEQKWNDVLTLLSPEYNGGYTFSAIQWYKDGQPIPDETGPYLYQPLDFGAEYQALLTNVADGVTAFTCPIQPVYHEQLTPFPTIVQAGQHMPIYMEQPTTIWYFTVSGQLYATYNLPRGYSTLYVPMQQGVYVLKATTQQGESQAQVMIVE